MLTCQTLKRTRDHASRNSPPSGRTSTPCEPESAFLQYPGIDIPLVAEIEQRLVGCATGLRTENNWFFLTDLWVAGSHRRQGLGSDLIRHLEDRVLASGVTDIYAETGGFEAPLFYGRCGYVPFFELKNFYRGGHSRFGFRKRLSPA